MAYLPAHNPEDWAVYQGLEESLGAYLRDPDIALEALAGVINFADVKAFTCERVATPQEAGESLWQEVAVTDGHRLILWHGDDEESEEDPGTLMFSSSVRTVPLQAVVDQGLRTRFTVTADGQRSLYAVMLYLSTQTPERSTTEIVESGTRTVQFVETYRFSKSVTDGGRGQMQRLMQFGRALSRFAGTTER